MKRFIKSFLRFFNLEIHKIPKARVDTKIVKKEFEIPEPMFRGLERVSKNGFSPSTIIDLGAARGTWSVSAMQFWQQSEYILFEPLIERKNELEQLKATYKNFHLIHAAAGKEKGVIDYFVADDLDGSAVSENNKSAKTRLVEVTTIDTEVRKLGLKPPYMIKFDTHGFEVPILEGAKNVLQQTEVIIMECYGFHISKNALLFHEMCSYLEKLNFRLADIVDIMRRPVDEFFWQCDLVFIKSSHQSFKKNTYQ